MLPTRNELIAAIYNEPLSFGKQIILINRQSHALQRVPCVTHARAIERETGIEMRRIPPKVSRQASDAERILLTLP